MDYEGNTPLHHAVQSRSLSVVKLLLETAANVLQMNHRGLTAYDIAKNIGNDELIQVIVEYRRHHIEQQSRIHSAVQYRRGSRIQTAISSQNNSRKHSFKPSEGSQSFYIDENSDIDLDELRDKSLEGSRDRQQISEAPSHHIVNMKDIHAMKYGRSNAIERTPNVTSSPPIIPSVTYHSQSTVNMSSYLHPEPAGSSSMKTVQGLVKQHSHSMPHIENQPSKAISNQFMNDPSPLGIDIKQSNAINHNVSVVDIPVKSPIDSYAPTSTSNTESNDQPRDQGLGHRRSVSIELYTPLILHRGSSNSSSSSSRISTTDEPNQSPSVSPMPSILEEGKGHSIVDRQDSRRISSRTPLNEATRQLNYDYDSPSDSPREINSHETNISVGITSNDRDANLSPQSPQSFALGNNSLRSSLDVSMSAESITMNELLSHSPMISLDSPSQRNLTNDLANDLTNDANSATIDVFLYEKAAWHIYIADSQDYYYYCPSTNHSQWEDPRLYGITEIVPYDGQI